MMFVQNSKVIELFSTKFTFALLPYSMHFIFMNSHFTKVTTLEIASVYRTSGPLDFHVNIFEVECPVFFTGQYFLAAWMGTFKGVSCVPVAVVFPIIFSVYRILAKFTVKFLYISRTAAWSRTCASC